MRHRPIDLGAFLLTGCWRPTPCKTTPSYARFSHLAATGHSSHELHEISIEAEEDLKCLDWSYSRNHNLPVSLRPEYCRRLEKDNGRPCSIRSNDRLTSSRRSIPHFLDELPFLIRNNICPALEQLIVTGESKTNNKNNNSFRLAFWGSARRLLGCHGQSPVASPQNISLFSTYKKQIIGWSG